MNFENHFTFDNFVTIMNLCKEGNWSNESREKFSENFGTPLLSFLTDLKEAEKLSSIQYSEGHLTSFSYCWNLFLEGKDLDYRKDTIAGFLDKFIFFNRVTSKDEEISIENYHKLSKEITEGDFTYFVMPEDNCICYNCAQHLKLSFENWKPKYSVFEKLNDGNLNYRHLVKPEDCISNAISELKINFPTGEVLVADWIKIKEFTDIVEHNDYSPEMSLNYLIGKINTTKHYAEKYNFVCVSLGNNSPNVYLYNGDLIVGKEFYNKELGDFVEVDKKYVGLTQVYTDFWGVTFIDKQQLIDILFEKIGNNAHKVVSDYIENDFTGEILNIQPGNYTLCFHGDYQRFNEISGNKDNILKLFELRNENNI